VTTPGRPRVVFDCNVLIQAAARPDGRAAGCLRLLDGNRIAVYVSGATIREVRAVFAYPTVRRAFPGLTDAQIARFIDRLIYKAVLVRRVAHVLDYPRARQDEPSESFYRNSECYSASAQTRGGSSSPKNSTRMTLGLQQTGQSSTYCCSPPPVRSSGMTIRSPHVGQTYAPSSAAYGRRPRRLRLLPAIPPHPTVCSPAKYRNAG